MNVIKRIILELAETLLTSFVIIFLIYQFIASMEVVSGSSMDPNFATDERILVDRISKFIKPYQRGEVVVLIPPQADNKHYIKRIIGIPGDIFKIFDCKVYITRDGERFQLTESYLYPGICTEGNRALLEGRSLRLEKDQYIVLGDNRPHSIDSRFFGVVTSKDLLGRVVFRFWPIKSAGFIR